MRYEILKKKKNWKRKCLNYKQTENFKVFSGSFFLSYLSLVLRLDFHIREEQYILEVFHVVYSSFLPSLFVVMTNVWKITWSRLKWADMNKRKRVGIDPCNMRKTVLCKFTSSARRFSRFMHFSREWARLQSNNWFKVSTLTKAFRVGWTLQCEYDEYDYR